MELPIEVETILISFNEQINDLVTMREALINVYKDIDLVTLHSLLPSNEFGLWRDLIAQHIDDTRANLGSTANNIRALQ